MADLSLFTLIAPALFGPSLGGLLVATVNGICVSNAASLPALTFGLDPSVHNLHAPWRYTVMSGVLPAIPLILIRPFLPESPIWEKKRSEGTLKRPSIGALFAPGLRRTTRTGRTRVATAMPTQTATAVVAANRPTCSCRYGAEKRA